MRGLEQTSRKYSGAGFRFGIVVSRFNPLITSRLLESAVETLKEAGATDDAIVVVKVPGAFEIPVAAQALAKRGGVDGILCLGCVIQGDTAHYDHVCRTAADGIAQVGLDSGLPVIFGILTTETREQAEARAGGKLGDMGRQGAEALLEMVNQLKVI